MCEEALSLRDLGTGTNCESNCEVVRRVRVRGLKHWMLNTVQY